VEPHVVDHSALLVRQALTRAGANHVGDRATRRISATGASRFFQWSSLIERQSASVRGMDV
jgi:hypothetical protein